MTAAVKALHFSLLLIVAGALITHFCGQQGTVRLTKGESQTSFVLDDGGAAALPFSMTLDDCGVELISGTASARDYFSQVTVDVDGRKEAHRVSMNNAMDIDGYRFCQSAIGDDSSVLTVNHDPVGRSVTFTAYYLLFASMVWVLFGRKSAFLKLARSVSRMAAIAVLLVPMSAFAEGPKALQRPLAKHFGHICVEASGRVEPVQTLARDFCLKVYGKDSYEGYTAEQVLTGFLFYYNDWKQEPIIKLKSKKAREIFGAKYISLADAYTLGQYRLEPLLSGEKPDRDAIADDEKISLISSVCTWSALKFIPEGSMEINMMLNEMSNYIFQGRFVAADSIVNSIIAYQKSEAPEAIPSEGRLRAEYIYNSSFFPLVSAIAAFMLAIVAFTGLFAERRLLFVLAYCLAGVLAVYLLFIFILRWIIGGYVPMSNGFETLWAMALIAIVVVLAVGRKIEILLPTGLFVVGAALMAAMAGSRNPSVGALAPVLSSRLLSLHVMLVMGAYALFAILTIIAAVGLISRKKRLYLATVSRMLLYPAVFLMGAGIFVGAIWADHSWGRYWGWDPKETWALITSIIYALPFHSKSIRIFRRSKPLLIYLLLAFLSVLMTYFGVNYFCTGLHSYAG